MCNKSDRQTEVSTRWPGNAGMVCDVPFMVALFLLTSGILLLPKYPLASPFLFLACYLIWKNSSAPSIPDYQIPEKVQAGFIEKARRLDDPPEHAVIVHRIEDLRGKSEDMDKVA